MGVSHCIVIDIYIGRIQWIMKMYPNEKYLELFARETVNGWTGWGDQLDLDTAKSPATKKGTLDDYEK